MGLRLVLLEEFGKAFVPKKARPYIRKYLLKAGINKVSYKFFGGLFYFTAFITGIIYMTVIYPYLTNFSPFVLMVLSFLSWLITQSLFVTLVILFVNFRLDVKIYGRTKEMEQMFPDFLQVVSSNLKGGMSFENALWAAIKPKFKILANEMAEVSKKVMTGYDVEMALIELSHKYDSLMLKRAIDLIISELQSGGNVADLLDRLVDNMKRTRNLKADMAASALSYVIFIGAIVILLAPLLFALSHSLLIIISNFMAKMATATQKVQGLPFKFGEVVVNIENFKAFSVAALVVISLFSSMIVSIVEKGDVKAGLKYIPLFIISSLILYFVFMNVLQLLFSGMYVV